MKHNWHPDELRQLWSLSTEEILLAQGKRIQSRLGYAVLLKYFQYMGRFPKTALEVPRQVIRHIADQLKVDSSSWLHYDWSGRTIKYHRSDIRKLMGFRQATASDSDELVDWLCTNCLADTQRFEQIEDAVYRRLRTQHIEPPTNDRVERLIRSALHRFDRQICDVVSGRLPPETCRRLDALLKPDDG
jgi:hypothetical protein